MQTSLSRLVGRAALWLLGLATVAGLLTLLLRGRLPDAALPDYVCFRAASQLLADGKDPYDPELEKTLQRQYGFQEQVVYGKYRHQFIAYHYPPWFGLLCMALLPLDYETARAAWLTVNLELLLLSGWLLRPVVRELSGATVAALAALFAFSQFGLWMAQTAPLALFLIVVAWRLMESGWDDLAGLVLAWLTFKPQVGGVVLLGVVAWAVCRRRWHLVRGLVLGFAVLAGVSFLFLPDWPMRMIGSTNETLQWAEHNPRLKTSSSWFAAFRFLGANETLLWIVNLVLAVPLFAAVLATARRRPLIDVIALSCLVTFLVSPYSQAYDFALLLVPWLVLLDSQPNAFRMVALLVVLLILPAVHILFWLGGPQDKFTLFWVPALLAILWLEREIFRANLSTH